MLGNVAMPKKLLSSSVKPNGGQYVKVDYRSLIPQCVIIPNYKGVWKVLDVGFTD